MSYTSTVLADAPLHFWPLPGWLEPVVFDIGSADAALVGTVVNPIPGYGGPASELFAWGTSGTSAYDLITDVFDAMGGSFSLECWFFFVAAPTGLFISLKNSGGAPAWGLGSRSAGGDEEFLGPSISVNDAGATVRGHWRHTVGVNDPSGQTLYVNGASVATGATAGAAMASSLFELVQSHGDRLIAAPAVYNVALSSGQVAAHYAAADLRSQHPSYTAPNPSAAADLATVLAAVQTTYSNS